MILFCHLRRVFFKKYLCFTALKTTSSLGTSLHSNKPNRNLCSLRRRSIPSPTGVKATVFRGGTMTKPAGLHPAEQVWGWACAGGWAWGRNGDGMWRGSSTLKRHHTLDYRLWAKACQMTDECVRNTKHQSLTWSTAIFVPSPHWDTSTE